MDSLEYSVIIRTMGMAGQKYLKLLKAISHLEPQPQEVIVVLPEGYELPAERLGWETFYFCRKGMVRQRMAGIKACKTDYALVCDDDVSFPSDFVKKLHQPIEKGVGYFSAAPLYSFLPNEGKETIIDMIMANAVPTILHRKNRYVSVLKSTGYSYNKHLDRSVTRYYETQAAPWTCFYADIQALKSLELDKETWLDAHGYSALDDQTMFYKAWLMGFKTIIVSDAVYEHMDARTAIRDNRNPVLYSRSFNRVVFWHRFIYSQQREPIGKLLSQTAFLYRLIWIEIWKILSLMRHRMSWKECRVCRKGFLAAIKYLKSDKYRELPPIIRG